MQSRCRALFAHLTMMKKEYEYSSISRRLEVTVCFPAIPACSLRNSVFQERPTKGRAFLSFDISYS